MFKKMRILVSAQHALMLAYRSEIYLWVLAHVLPFIMMSIWTNAASHTGDGGGGGGGGFSMTSAQYAHYFLAVFIVRQFSIVWMIYDFEWNVVEGRMSYLLLRPFNPLWHFVSAHFGEQIARFPFFLLILVVVYLVNPQAFWWPTPFAVVGGIGAIYASFALRFALQYCLAQLTFWFERASSIDNLFMLPFFYFSGFIIPLSDLPATLRTAVQFTPFPYMVSFPARILTGDLGWGPELFAGLGVMLGWFLLLTALGAALWKRGLLRYSGHGA